MENKRISMLKISALVGRGGRLELSFLVLLFPFAPERGAFYGKSK